MVRYARRRAGMTQRELARAASTPQATVGRIEAGIVSARMDTVTKLLAATGYELAIAPRLGQGVDRTLIASGLALTPEERVLRGGAAGRNLLSFRRATRARKRG